MLQIEIEERYGAELAVTLPGITGFELATHSLVSGVDCAPQRPGGDQSLMRHQSEGRPGNGAPCRMQEET
jgi:hypothetical protein